MNIGKINNNLAFKSIYITNEAQKKLSKQQYDCIKDYYREEFADRKDVNIIDLSVDVVSKVDLKNNYFSEVSCYKIDKFQKDIYGTPVLISNKFIPIYTPKNKFCDALKNGEG